MSLGSEVRVKLAELERLRQIEQVVREWLPVLDEEAYEMGYGFYSPNDPRDFTPDEECCTPEEIAAWRKACTQAEATERGEHPCPAPESDGDAASLSWGIGGYRFRTKWADLRDTLQALLEAEAGERPE